MRIEEENLFSSMSVGAGGTLSLSQISDVSDSINPSSGQVLTWNGNLWVAATPSGGSGGGATLLSELNDVGFSYNDSSAPTNNQVLTYDTSKYNSSTGSYGAWVAKNSGGGFTPINTVEDGQVFAYSSYSDNWVNRKLSLSDLENVDEQYHSPGSSGLLIYDGSAYGYRTIDLDYNVFSVVQTTDYYNNTIYKLTVIGGGSGGASQLKELSDVYNYLNPSDNQVLVYSAYTDSGKWTARQLTIEDLGDVDLTDLADGYVLVYDSTLNHYEGGWVAQDPSGTSSSITWTEHLQ